MTQESDALRYILDKWVNRLAMPNNKEMNTFFGDTKTWVNVRGKLIAKGKLKPSDIYDFELVESVIEEYKRIQAQVARPVSEESNSLGDLMPVSIPLLGTVKAGKDGFDELILDDSPSGDMIMVPDVEPGQNIYSLEVVGESMISDHILPNDIIIIESASIVDLNEYDLVVAKYLDEKFNDADDDEKIALAINDPDNFVGPTLKYFSKEEFKRKVRGRLITETLFRLSPKNRDSEYTIRTRALEEGSLGRVVALHRPIRRL